MRSSTMKDKLTIVIPCLNEFENIGNLLTDLNESTGIDGVKVYVADAGSTDGTQQTIKYMSDIWYKLDIELIKGGRVSRGRNAGLELCDTPWVLFIDADVRLSNNYQVKETLDLLESGALLVGAPLRSRSGTKSDRVYRLFNWFNNAMNRIRPFAVGSWFATDAELIRSYGGWDEEVLQCEDWLLSKNYPSSKYKKTKSEIIIDDRRFKKMGYFGMLKLMLLSFVLGRKYMKKDIGYWN
jgi:glycosyltransferase involved in cell wall biosynthesis